MKTYCTIQALAINDKGKYLITKRAKGSSIGEWRPVTGYIKERESAEDAAVRELKEETDLDGEVIATSLPYYVESKDKRYINVSLLLRVHKISYIKIDKTEASDYLWIDENNPLIESSIVLKKVMKVLKII